jgi:hypothetical protein
MTCLTYLSFEATIGFCPTYREFEARLQLNPLYEYAARNWGHHARVASVDEKQLILDILESEAKLAGQSQAMMASEFQRVPGQISGAHVAEHFGLRDAMATL